MQTTELSVIIAAYNGVDLLIDCLESIDKYNDIGDALEIIVSDNSSNPDIEKVIGERFPNVKYRQNENRGFGWANNRGYEISSGKYLLFLNPDTVLVEPVFGFALEKFGADPDLAMFGVRLLNGDGTDGFSFGSMDIYTLSAAYKNKRAIKNRSYTDGKMFTSGADMFIRRDVFEKIGMFDENIFMYFEEADIVHRIKNESAALKTAYFDEKKIVHLGGATENDDDMTKIVKFAERMNESERYYAEKHGFDYKKILKYRLNVSRLKKLICGLKGHKRDAEKFARLTEFYKKQLSVKPE